ncbi:hypothetical protein [Meiothermus granaticius]|uniref:Uncharacterized protein n=1 Tax=Meiothermus granaticius NBRC 107808 TaxID=1227551 RepID=A0A399F9L1_9DEIN|nr:hypothetical protein [Meiothermus granaticius]MCL6526460.1 hypothetical protein [Thermaceae bacterium]RIH92918.1 hypothetical protein Mgrana_01193 [Meiothermus granaticius NBRC 107808]GEM86774.1 hypothetical protein MGR01S_13990 [Meiothermus granaticius NBRC 107808]
MARFERNKDVNQAWEGYERMDPKDTRRDWLILVGLMVIYVLWFGLIYLLEPGIGYR